MREITELLLAPPTKAHKDRLKGVPLRAAYDNYNNNDDDHNDNNDNEIYILVHNLNRHFEQKL